MESEAIHTLCSSYRMMSLPVGTGTDKEYISVYRSLAGIWIILALAWLTLIFNMADKVMDQLLVLTQPSFGRRDTEDTSSGSLEDTSKV